MGVAIHRALVSGGISRCSSTPRSSPSWPYVCPCSPANLTYEHCFTEILQHQLTLTICSMSSPSQLNGWACSSHVYLFICIFCPDAAWLNGFVVRAVVPSINHVKKIAKPFSLIQAKQPMRKRKRNNINHVAVSPRVQGRVKLACSATLRAEAPLVPDMRYIK